jgi:hypothetical protein
MVLFWGIYTPLQPLYASTCADSIGGHGSALACIGNSPGDKCIGNRMCAVVPNSPSDGDEVICSCVTVKITVLEREDELGELIDASELTCEQPNDKYTYEKTFKHTLNLTVETGIEVGIDWQVVSAKASTKFGIEVGEEVSVKVSREITPRTCKDIEFELYKRYRKITYKVNQGGLEATFSIKKLLPSPNVKYISVERNEECCPLIVDLVSFQITPSSPEGNINLEWITATEKENIGFRLWRAQDIQNSNKVNDKKYGDITMLEELSPSRILESNRPECMTEVRGDLTDHSTNELSKLIWSMGDSRKGTCYSLTDRNIEKEGTYYYLLEDDDANGNRTFHCDKIAAVTVGQGPAIDLDSAKQYCWSVTE